VQPIGFGVVEAASAAMALAPFGKVLNRALSSMPRRASTFAK
jgi:hypothetical protein